MDLSCVNVDGAFVSSSAEIHFSRDKYGRYLLPDK